MILHVTFTNGANGLVYYGTADKLATAWRRIEKADPAARCDFFTFHKDSLHCKAVAGGGYAVARYFDGAHKAKTYKKLLPALRYIERGPQ